MRVVGGADECIYTYLADGGRIDCQRDARLTGRAGTEISVYTRIERVAIVCGDRSGARGSGRADAQIGVDTPIKCGRGVGGRGEGDRVVDEWWWGKCGEDGI
jgi:hypothetical protein